MSLWGDLAKGGIEGIAKGIGGMAKDIRAAVTGKSVLNNDDLVKLQTIAHEMEIAALEADKAVIQGQIDINKIEAQSGSNFRAGWRPAIGWVCVLALLYQFLLRPLLPWFFDVFGFHAAVLPTLEIGSLLTLLGGMLGLGSMRTFEKVRGMK
jgi:hypothetical protein